MLRKIFSYGTFAVITVLLQLILIIYAVTAGADIPAVGFFYRIVTYILVFYILNQPVNNGYKLGWIVPMLCFPVYGGFFYLIFSRKHSAHTIQKKMIPYLGKESKNISAATPENGIQKYLSGLGFPVCSSKESNYYPTGEALFHEMLKRISQAENYIYIEFFIISDGKAWTLMERILTQKAAEGVKIRIIADSAGCLFTKPPDFKKRLEKIGAEYTEFNPVSVRITGRINYRNHRKILVCDGKYAFCCGINISDEYMNYKERFGTWKDSGVMVDGSAAESFTAMFIEMWNYLTKSNETVCIRPYEYEQLCIVQPFCNSPLDSNSTGLRTYLSLINAAGSSVCLTTPYLICDDEMLESLIFAAKKGVSVKIITPGVPDKKYVYTLTRSFYKPLISAGVGIYEYTPGFIHSKTLVVDDKTAVVGSINFDYRSMFLLYESACIFYGGNVVKEISADFNKTLEVSDSVSLSEVSETSLIVRIVRCFLKLFAPLL